MQTESKQTCAPEPPRTPSFIDRAFQIALKSAYQLMRCYWYVRCPTTQGAQAALWFEGRILIIKNSYLRQYSLPGGYVKKGERPVEAAVRELSEEVGIFLPADRLRKALEWSIPFNGKTDTGTIFETTLDSVPPLRIDHREVIRAEFLTPENALSRELLSPVADYLRNRKTPRSSG